MKKGNFLSKLKRRFLASDKSKRYDFITFCLSCLLLVALVVIEILVIVTCKEWWWIGLILCVLLTASFCVGVFVELSFKKRIPFDIFNFLACVSLSLINKANFSSTLFNIVLANFYLKNNIKTNIIMAVCAFVCYLSAAITGTFVLSSDRTVVAVLSSAFSNDLVYFVLIFTFINLISTTMRKNKELSFAVEEIAEREKKLKEANEELSKTAVLQERNRIAKQIHDTTGHSITTIIMQTEAAKLIIDKDPEEAKKKIISANLFAINALEEMRTAVHVLGGENNGFDLISSLTATINNTTENTNITIRTKIDDDISVDKDLGMFIFSSLKEGLNNGIRHGNGTAFYFELTKKEGCLRFVLSDNGTGTEDVKPGFGLKKMKEQAESFGGKITFSSAKGEGFEIEIIIPLQNKGEPV